MPIEKAGLVESNLTLPRPPVKAIAGNIGHGGNRRCQQQRDRNANRQQRESANGREATAGQATSATSTEERQGSNGGAATENREGGRKREGQGVIALALANRNGLP